MNKLIALILFFLPFQTQWIVREGMVRGEVWQYGTIGIFAVDILIVGIALIGSWNAWRSSGPRGIVRLNQLGVIGWWIIPLLASVLLSIIAAQDKGVAWLHAFWVVEAIALGWSVFYTQHRRLAQIAFCAGAVFQAVIGLWQFFSQSTVASSLLGIAVHPVWQGGTSVVELAGERWLRAYAGLPHPNIFGGYMAIAIILLVGLIVIEAQIHVRRVLLVMLVVLSAGLSVSFSRSALISVGVGLAILWVLCFRYCESRPLVGAWQSTRRTVFDRFALLAMTTTIILLSFFVVLVPYRALFEARVEHSARLEQQSISERERQYRQAWEMIRTQRWMRSGGYRGVAGVGNYTLTVSNAHPEIPLYNVQPVHNVFVLIAAETHSSALIWLGFILYYCVKRALGITPLSSFKRHLWKQLQDPRSALPLALLGALVPLLLLDHYLWSLHTGLLLFVVSIGFISRDA